jgi:uncharacterized protein YfaS (alpha-2-macroglobulin family)
MTAPTVAAALDKATYKPGDTMTLTVTYADPDRQTLTITTTVVDSTGNTAQATVAAVIDPATVAVTSTPPKAWTKVSDTGTVAVFTATA